MTKIRLNIETNILYIYILFIYIYFTCYILWTFIKFYILWSCWSCKQILKIFWFHSCCQLYNFLNFFAKLFFFFLNTKIKQLQYNLLQIFKYPKFRLKIISTLWGKLHVFPDFQWPFSNFLTFASFERFPGLY